MGNGLRLYLRDKITATFALFTLLLMGVVYLIFETSIKEKFHQMEREKATMIARAIEPNIGMQHFLGLEDEVRATGEATLKNRRILGLCIYLEGKRVFSDMSGLKGLDPVREEKAFNISYPIQGVLTGEPVGRIDLHYSKEEYRQSLQSLRTQFFYIVVALVFFFGFVSMALRYFLRPLEQIRQVLERYEVGEGLGFGAVRSEVETDRITQAFAGMLARINEHHETIQHQNMELARARERADQANKSKSVFLANMSHEVRTPLNAIIGFVDLLESMEEDPEKYRYLKTIQESGQSLLGIINDILDFSKIESGKLELESILFDPHREFSGVAALFCAKSGDKGIRFDVFVDPELPGAFRSDPLRIKQVLANLLSNAIKFTPEEGRVSMEVRCRKESATVDFIVEDTGVGIAPENMEKIFQPFSQEDSSTSRRFGGTGLGLSISRQLVEMMGGTLLLESNPGRGSRFTFTLPLSPDPEEAERLVRKEGGKGTRWENLRVILCFGQANRHLAENLAFYLASFRCRSPRFSDSLEAVEPEAWDLLFADEESAGDGERLKALLERQLPVIFYRPAGEVEKGRNWNGPVEYLECPVTPSSTLDAVNRLLAPGSGGGRSAAAVMPRYEGRVLVVEDVKANQLLMEVLLKKRKVEFRFADNGEEALEVLERERFDLVLMDEHMPVMNGLEATRRQLARERREGLAHTPVAALTANALKGDRERFLEVGMDDYLQKPVNVKELERVLDRFLRRIGTTEEAQTETEPERPEEELERGIRRFRQEMGADDGQLAEFLELYLEGAREALEGIRQGLEEGAPEKVAAYAHALKGTNGALGLERATEAAKELEARGKAGTLEPEACRELFRMLEEAAARVEGYAGTVEET